MPSNKRTPASVLKAPKRSEVTIATPQGATRAERRHGVVVPEGLATDKEKRAYLRRLSAKKNRNSPSTLEDRAVDWEIAERAAAVAPTLLRRKATQLLSAAKAGDQAREEGTDGQADRREP